MEALRKEPESIHVLIESRYDIIRRWLRRVFADHPQWDDTWQQPDQHQHLRPWLADVRPTASFQRELVILATCFDLFAQAHRTALRQCYHQGCFDRLQSRVARIDQNRPLDIQPVPPTPRDILKPVRALLQRHSDRQGRIRALVQPGYCRNRGNAQAVVALIEAHDHRLEQRLGQTCLRDGLIQTGPDPLSPPNADTIVQTVRSVMQRTPIVDQWAVMLVQSGICATLAGAQVVVDRVVQHDARSPNDTYTLRQCLERGLFNRLPARTQEPSATNQKPCFFRPAYDEIERQVKQVLQHHTERESQVTALIATVVCQDEHAAHQVVTALDRHALDSTVNHIAATLAWRVLSAYADHGLDGLLVVSHDSLAEVLIRLQTMEPYISDTSPHPSETLDILRRDLMVLYQVAMAVDETEWNPERLYAPILSDHRQQSQRRTNPERRNHFQATHQRFYHEAPESHTLLTLLDERGLSGIVDWRCGVPMEQTGHAWETSRLRHILDLHLGALPHEARQTIEPFVLALRTALYETGLTVSLTQLLDSQPFSAFRKRLNRRLPVSYGVVQFWRRNQNRQNATTRRRRVQHPKPVHDPLAAGAALVDRFASLTGLSEREAATRLYQVRTYGGIGFLPKESWRSLIDERLLSLLKLLSFGRIEGRFDLYQALQRLHHYADRLGLPPLSAQLSRALIGVMPKPKRWNSGESDRIASVRKRAGVVLPGQPWLHRVWRLFSITLNRPITASPYSEASAVSHLLLVVDLGSQRPVGGWVSAHPPGSAEVGLALFQSIWHPGALDWPLRGVPEVLQVPESLLTDSRAVLDHAEIWLLVKSQIIPDSTQPAILKKLPTTQMLLDALVYQGLDEIHRRNDGHALTCKAMHDATLGWIRTSETGFRHHTPGLPDPDSQSCGYAAPAFDTPAAGLLLPVQGQSTTVRDGVVVQGRRFASPTFRSEPGQAVSYRAFPYLYDGLKPGEGMTEAIYVECEQEGMVHYLTRQR